MKDIQAQLDQHAKDEYALFWAVRTEKPDIIKFLLKKGTKVDFDNNEIIREAIRKSDVQLVELLLKQGANANHLSFTTCVWGNVEILQTLIKYNLDVNCPQCDWLLNAIRHTGPEFVKNIVNTRCLIIPFPI